MEINLLRHKGFPGGLILPNDKVLSEGLAIQDILAPSTVQVALDDGADGSAEPNVLAGQMVSPGQCIAVASDADGVNVHSPVSGQVRQIEQIILADGSPVAAITIDSSEQEELDRAGDAPSWKMCAEGLIECLPIHRVYLTAWMRWGLFAGFHLSFKFFAVRGFWVVLFYIFFDVLAVVLVLKSNTAHWAHIGGLICGMSAAVILLVGRSAHSRTDALSLIFGKYAWPLLGSPSSHNKRPS